MKSDELLLKECEWEAITVSGPGGQNRNRTYSGVRLRHLPTGLVVTATERSSQSSNKKIALERLKAKLSRLFKKSKPRVPTKKPRSSQEKRLDKKSGRSKIKKMRERIKY